MHSVFAIDEIADRLPPIWSWFQRRFFVIVCLGVATTLTYIGILVLPRMGVSLNGAPVAPGWQSLNNTILNVHIITAIPPLILGLPAFSRLARRASGRIHRWIGTTYCIGIWLSAATGLLLALANQHGLIAKAGFSTLAVAWFTTTLYAYLTARRKDFIAHRRWMIRSYAITLAVVTVRPMFLFGPPAGLDQNTWYQIVTWLCWVPNLAIAEFYTRITLYSGRLGLPRRGSGRPRRRSAERRASIAAS